MISITASIAFVVVLGVGAQVYSLVQCTSLLGGSTEIRYVLGNELVQLWSCLAGILASWTSVHLLVKSSGIGSGRNQDKPSINWLPVGVQSQVIMWSAYLVMALGLNIAASTMQYKLGHRGSLALPALNYALPIASAAMSMPNLIRRLRSQTKAKKHAVDMQTAKVAEDDVSLNSYQEPFKLPSPREFDNASVFSDVTRHSARTKHTVVGNAGSLRSALPSSGKNMPRADNSPLQFPDCELRIVPSNTTTLVPNSNQLTCAQHIKAIGIAIARYGPVPVATALLSILVYTLLLCGAIEQHQHKLAVPVMPELVTVSAVYSDNIERTVSFSVSCKGHLVDKTAYPLYGPPQQATILLEHVGGYPSFVSKSLQNALVAQNHRVCMYDRPGYMFSPQGYTPMSPVTMERALSSALRKIGEVGPFYVVGHRSGAEYAQVFANMNLDLVVGAALVYPTDTALVGLLSANQTESVRMAKAQTMMDSSQLPEAGLLLPRLNIQRALAALGTWMTSPPTLSDTSTSQDVTDWTLSSPYLAQAQYFEMQQQQHLAQIVSDLKLPPGGGDQLPVLLFGVSTERSAQIEYLAAAASFFKVEIADPDDLQPLSLNRVAKQISLHMAQLH